MEARGDTDVRNVRYAWRRSALTILQKTFDDTCAGETSAGGGDKTRKETDVEIP